MTEPAGPKTGGAAERRALIRRYGLILGLAYAVLLAAAIGFFVLQMDGREKDQWQTIAGRVKEHALILDALAGAVASRVHELQSDADGRRPPAGSEGWVPTERDFPGDPMVALPPTAAIAGTLDRRSAEGRDELRSAGRLSEEFRYLVSLLPIVERGYYISQRGFGLLLPATEPEAEAFVDSPVASALVVAVGPDSNPTGGPVWLDSADLPVAGTAVLRAAPVRRDGRILGAVALAVSSGYLNRVNGDFDYPVGTTMLLGANGTLLAHPPRPGGPEVALGRHYREALDADTSLAVKKALSLTDRRIVGDGVHLLYAERLESAPWTLVYVGDRRTVLWTLVADHGPQTLALAAVLTLMLLVAGGLTGREFVDPASRLVEHIKAAGEADADAPAKVPVVWRPWFRTVTSVFRENADLVRLRQELQIARDMQASVLPRQPLRHRRLNIVGRMHPALEVGGDFYDYFRIDDDRIGIVIADVSGKGVPASLFMMITRTLLKAAGLAGDSPGTCMARVNDLLEAENDAAMFVTVFYGVIDLTDGSLRYANGGHNPPILLRADGTTVSLPSLGDPILAVVPGASFKEGRLDLHPGDALLLYTDGLTEAFSAAGEEFGDDRLFTALSGARGLSAAAIAGHCIDAVELFATGAAQADDMTCLVARIEPEG